jgi:hypothetical protein
MSLANRAFKNNRTGDVIKVIDSFENIAILENKQKIDTRTLMDPNQYTEQIDPASFFNNQGAYNILAEKIKNIPTQNFPDEPLDISNKVTTSFGDSNLRPASNESAIIMSSEDDERAELERKYGIQQPNPQDSLAKQNEAFAKLLGDEEEPIQRFEVKNETRNVNQSFVNTSQPVESPTIQRVEVEDPIIKMFKGVKRNVDFNITIDIDNKIPRLDFIEMMEDSYETSIIEFLADEFTREIVTNPEKIKSMISDKIKSMLSSKSVNNQITDSVTQTHKEDVSVNSQTSEVKVTKPKTTKKTKKEN